MSGFLFHEIIFGPVLSRRLGISLGINLLPAGKKACNYNCIYCECGLSPATTSTEKFPHKDEVLETLERTLQEFREKSKELDAITYAGNGEPTLHKDFHTIIDGTIRLRDKYFPGTKIAVLSNATKIGTPTIDEALKKVDLNILKFDTAIQQTYDTLNCNGRYFSIEKLTENLINFNGKKIIQTLFVKGSYKGIDIDNTLKNEVEAWLSALVKIKPDSVMIYSIARKTPVNSLKRIEGQELHQIAEMVKAIGIEVVVSD